VWRDWVLLALVLGAAVVEVITRPDIVWPWAAGALAVLVAASTLWRRTHPLPVVLIVFGASLALSLAARGSAPEPFGLYVMVVALVLPYALSRWASGRDAVIGVAWILLTATVQQVVVGRPVDLVAAFALVLTAAALGVAVRATASSRRRQVEEYRLLEREQLARELHDTVAHHVSAIAIQAQAAQVVGSANPGAVDDALRTIESEATLALTEMRSLVGTLRDDRAPELAPQRGVADVASLARAEGASPVVDVVIDGDVAGLAPAVDAAVFRIAQESVTNSLRHARSATRVDVRVVGHANDITVDVTDDGAPVAPGREAGFGLVGMAERADLLQGAFHAGPEPGRGWRVSARLPRTGRRP
jgi:signal transduction histidine kinase